MRDRPTATSVLKGFIDVNAVVRSINKVQPSNSINMVYQLDKADVQRLHDTLEPIKDMLRGDRNWTEAQTNEVVLVSDASLYDPEKIASNTSLVTKIRDDYRARTTPATSTLAEHPDIDDHAIAIMHELKRHRPYSCIIPVYVHFDKADNDDEKEGWYLTGLVRPHTTKQSIELCSLSKHPSLAGTFSANVTRSDVSGPNPRLSHFYVQPLIRPSHTEPHTIVGAVNERFLVWSPATKEPLCIRQGGGIFCQNTKVPTRLPTLLQVPDCPRALIKEMFYDLHKTFLFSHPGQWYRIVNRRPISDRLRATNHNIMKDTATTRQWASTNQEKITTRSTLHDYIRAGLTPTIVQPAYIIALAWSRDRGSAGSNDVLCSCFTGLGKTTCRMHTKDDTHDDHRTRPADDTSDDDKDNNAHFTCTCGFEASTATLLDIHCLTAATSASSPQHHRCGPQSPSAGGAYIIFNRKTHKSLAGGQVDCTPCGRDRASTLSAESMTALHGYARLLEIAKTLPFRPHIVLLCDNSGVPLRTAMLQYTYLSSRQKTKLPDLAIGMCMADYCTALEAVCESIRNAWHGAEHNMVKLADRSIYDAANNFVDHFADTLTTILHARPDIRPTAPAHPQLTNTPIAFTINGTITTQPLGPSATRNYHLLSVHNLTSGPPARHDNVQLLQHLLHAINNRFDHDTSTLVQNTTSNRLSDVRDRARMDCIKMTDAALLSNLPNFARRSAATYIKQLRRDPDKRCLLCYRSYPETATMANVTRHYIHDCKHFEHHRTWLHNRFNAIINSTGKMYRTHRASATGFCTQHTDDAQTIGTLQLDANEQISIATASGTHTFDVERLTTTWHNWCLQQEHRPRLRHFIQESLRMGHTTISAARSIQPVWQPHPGVLRELQQMFNLEQQHSTSFYNSTSDIFPCKPHIDRSLSATLHSSSSFTDAIGLGENFVKSAFIVISTASPSWRQEMLQISRSRTTNKSVTIICMLVRTAGLTPTALASMLQKHGGVNMIHCPHSSITGVGTLGFREDIDPDVKHKTQADYRQANHKITGKRRARQSYSFNQSGCVVAPLDGNARTTPRHHYSTIPHHVNFLYFGPESAEELHDSQSHRFDQLATCFTQTNPPDISADTSKTVTWVAGHDFKCTADAGRYTQSYAEPWRHRCQLMHTNWPTSRYREETLCPGYTSSFFLSYLESLGLRKQYCRAILARHAINELHMISVIETSGTQTIQRRLHDFGCPITAASIQPSTELATCTTTDKCKLQTCTKLFTHIDEHQRNERRSRCCSLCVLRYTYKTSSSDRHKHKPPTAVISRTHDRDTFDLYINVTSRDSDQHPRARVIKTSSRRSTGGNAKGQRQKMSAHNTLKTPQQGEIWFHRPSRTTHVIINFTRNTATTEGVCMTRNDTSDPVNYAPTECHSFAARHFVQQRGEQSAWTRIKTTTTD